MSLVAKRYANAFFELSLEAFGENKGTLESLLLDLNEFYTYFGSEQVLDVLVNPSYLLSLKEEILYYPLTFLEKDIKKNQLLKGLLTILWENKRIELLPEVCLQCEKLLDHHLGKQTVMLTTARLLEKEEEQEFIAVLGHIFKKNIKLKSSVDKNLLGGFKIESDLKELDRTMRLKLNQLTQMAK